MAVFLKAEIKIDEVIKNFKREIIRSKKMDDGSVLVGYTAKHSMFVHELIGMKLKGQKRPTKGRYWDPQGKAKAKFLEEPLRRSVRGLVAIVRKNYKRTRSLISGLLAAGKELKRISVRFAPKETGELRESAFVEEEK